MMAAAPDSAGTGPICLAVLSAWMPQRRGLDQFVWYWMEMTVTGQIGRLLAPA
jgi:hypothetical protein